MPMILTFAAMSAKAAAAGAAAGTALTAAAPIAATTAATTAAAAAAPTLAASAIPGIVGGASPALSAAAPAATAAQGIGAGAQAMSPEIAANIGQAAAQNAATQSVNPAVLNNAGQVTSSYSAPSTAAQTPVDPGITNPNFAQQGPAPQVPQAVDQNLASQPGINQSMPTEPVQMEASRVPDINQIEANIKAETSQQFPVRDFAPTESASTGLQKGFESAMKFAKDNPMATMVIGQGVTSLMNSRSSSGAPPKKQYARKDMSGFQASEPSTIEYNPIFQPTPYAEGGIASYAVGGPVEQMSAQNAIGNNMMYPQSQLQTDTYSNPMVQRPIPTNVIQSGIDAPVGRYTGEQMYAKGGTTVSTDASKRYAQMMGIKSAEQQRADEEYLDAYAKREMGKSINTDTDVDTRTKDPLNASLTSLKKIGKRVGIKPVDLPKSNTTDSNVFHAAANGGIMHSLGGYSDGGRLLRGPGDGVSDSIPATIGNRQPARLADGEFVVPARIVSELGNGSTEAGARKLYQMMERIQADRKKSIGKGKVAVNSKATKHLPK
jgi:hypothetical protein